MRMPPRVIPAPEGGLAMRTSVTVAAVALSITGAAQAASIGGGVLYAPQTYYEYCWYINDGPASVTPTAQQIFNSNSTTADNATLSCANGQSIAAHQTCVVADNDTTIGNGYSCLLTFSGSAANPRRLDPLQRAVGHPDQRAVALGTRRVGTRVVVLGPSLGRVVFGPATEGAVNI